MPDRNIFGSIDEFRRAAQGAGESAIVDARVRAALATEVKAGDGDSRTLTFTISTSSPDRAGDTIAQDGWKLDAFRKNPVVLWAHDGRRPPLAKAPRVWIEGDKLKAEAEFIPAETPEIGAFAEAILQLYRGGFMSATSVGFAPLKYAFADDPARRYGIDFLEQELLEFSCVPVPANAEALIEGKSAGIDVAPVIDWAREMLASSGLAVIERQRLEAIAGLPAKFRGIAAALPEKAKGARGQLLRCANMAAREIGAAEVEEAPEQPREPTQPPAPVVTPRLNLARRRLELMRSKIG